MRLARVSASALFILINACSSNEADSVETDTTDTVDTAGVENSSVGTSTRPSTSDAPDDETSVDPNDGTTQTSSPTTGNTSSNNDAPDTTESWTGPMLTRPPSSEDTDTQDTADTTDGQASSEDPGDDSAQTEETTEPDTSSDTSEETSDSDTSNDTTDVEVVDTGADDKFSFFVTSYYHMAELSGSEDGFGGDLRYNGAATGLDGADAICQEIARRVGFGHRTWRAYLSTSTVNAIDRIGDGPWYDFVGALVADSPADLITGANRQPGGCCETGTYDEMGLFHDGSTDQNNDGIDDDDHDTMTATQEDGTYSGFSCEDWTSTSATAAGSGGGGGQPGGGGGGGGGIMMGHSWPARSGEHWATSHGGHQCAAGTNFIQNGGGDSSTVGGGGGYGGFYCFALAE